VFSWLVQGKVISLEYGQLKQGGEKKVKDCLIGRTGRIEKRGGHGCKESGRLFRNGAGKSSVVRVIKVPERRRGGIESKKAKRLDSSRRSGSDEVDLRENVTRFRTTLNWREGGRKFFSQNHQKKNIQDACWRPGVRKGLFLRGGRSEALGIHQ